MYPMMGSTALFMEHVEGPVPIAATNGRQVIFGKGFAPLSDPQKNGVVLHEYLHCVLSHPQRGALLRMKLKDDYCPTGFNIAADALINVVIREDAKRTSLIGLPDGCIDIDMIRKDLITLGIIESDGLPTATTSVETIYDKLMQARRMQQEERPHNEGGVPGGARATENDPERNQALDRIAGMFRDEPDLVADEGTAEEMRERIREQGARLANASSFGNSHGNLLERIKGDIPLSRVPWESRFRTISARHLARERRRTNRKPSGAMISRDAMGGRAIWESGRMRTPKPKALVIADSSGSIGMDLYLGFLGELDGMRRRTNATLLFAQADTQLGDVREITDTSDLRTLSLGGRGGTDFIQPLAVAEEMQVDLVIYMTDLDGSFPEKCGVPVIWVAPEGKSRTPPFGRLVEIP
jgi:predicted metal-dependent peptidase